MRKDEIVVHLTRRQAEKLWWATIGLRDRNDAGLAHLWNAIAARIADAIDMSPGLSERHRIATRKGRKP